MALRTGDVVPNLEIKRANGKTARISGLLKGKKHLLIVFFRGSWCSFCNLQLADLSKNYKKFKALKTELLGISVDDRDTLKEMKQKHSCPFPLGADPSRKIMKLFGIKDFVPVTGALLHGKVNYPKPAVFLLDSERRIVFTYIGKTFFDRLKAKNLLKVIQS